MNGLLRLGLILLITLGAAATATDQSVSAAPLPSVTASHTTCTAAPGNLTIQGTIRFERRGDAKANGVVSVADALFIGQYLNGLRGIGEGSGSVYAVNAASPKLDPSWPDKITVADALYVSQYVAGLRDSCFNLIP